MKNFGDNFDVHDFVRLMKDYLDQRIDVNQYQKMYFDMTIKLVTIPSGDVDRIIQQAYGDADDYDPVVRLPYTIEEPELRARVANSLRELASLGYSVER
jgi:hypothetical protein